MRFKDYMGAARRAAVFGNRNDPTFDPSDVVVPGFQLDGLLPLFIEGLPSGAEARGALADAIYGPLGEQLVELTVINAAKQRNLDVDAVRADVERARFDPSARALFWAVAYALAHDADRFHGAFAYVRYAIPPPQVAANNS